jgi:hypothetical protein
VGPFVPGHIIQGTLGRGNFTTDLDCDIHNNNLSHTDTNIDTCSAMCTSRTSTSWAVVQCTYWFDGGGSFQIGNS